jgi:hypothetical protein
MTDAINKEVPATGKSSPAGRRWFISKYPELTLTKKPADIIVSDNGKERPQKPQRIPFMKQMKPAHLKGTGLLGRANADGGDGSDRNDSHFWGVFTTEDQEIIDWLRDHEYYRTTRQDNVLEREMKLKELDWDPRAKPSDGGGLVARRTVADLNGDPKNDAPQAPEEGVAARPRTRVMLGKKS